MSPNIFSASLGLRETMNEFKLWSTALEWLKQGKNPVMVIIAETKGSSPGKAGFKMAVNMDSEFVGTVGGAIFEANIIKSPPINKKPFLKKYVHNPNAPPDKRSGLNCAGSQQTIFFPLTQKEVPILEEIVDAIEKSIPSKLTVTENSLEIETLNNLENIKRTPELTFTSNKWIYSEIVGFPYAIYIFGNGHTGIALSQVMKNLGFKVICIDNRETTLENPFADRIEIGEFASIAKNISSTPRTFVVICTYSMETDTEVLQALLDKNIPYIGLMGSKAKLEKIKKRIGKAFPGNVHAPVGIPINDETPAEIAISIAAEIIHIKNSR